MTKERKSILLGLYSIKRFRKMKVMTLFLILNLSIGIANNTYSQKANFSLNLNNKTLKEVFKDIESKSRFSFFYQDHVLDIERRVDVQVKDQPINKILDQLFAETDNTYVIDGYQVFISKKAGKAQDKSKKVKIRGNVTDINSDPLPGASVILKNNPAVGVTTDIDGNYEILVDDPNEPLLFRYLGYVEKEEEIAKRSIVNVVLQEDIGQLDEVVVVGFGRQKKGSVTSAVTTMQGKELRAPTRSVSNALAGKIAGVISIQRTGEPGNDNSEFWIRGISSFAGGTSPLVLVDGVPRNMNDIEVDEIETFTVLKDAAATAIYGAEGANGVVLITSKRGKEQAARITYRGEVSTLTPTRRPRYANAYDYLSLYNEAKVNEGELPSFSDDTLEKYRTHADPDLYPDTDWWDVLINDHTYNTRHTLNFRGGTNKARYFVSAAFFKESGYFKSNPEYNNNSGLERYNLRSNIDIDITKNTLLRVDLSGQYYKQSNGYTGTTTLFERISRTPPHVIPPVYSDGTLAQSKTKNSPWVLMTESGYKKTWRTFIQSNVGLEQKLDFLTPGLKVRGLVSYDFDANFFMSRSKVPDSYYATGREPNGALIFDKIENEVKFGNPQTSNNSVKKIYMEAALDYARVFNKVHDVTALLLTYRKDEQRHDNALPFRKEQYMGRATYSYDSRYTIEASFGITGSEQFAEGHRYGFFPAIGVAWNIVNEPYFPRALASVFSNLKLRGSYGKTGNDKTGSNRFMYAPTFKDSGSYSMGIGSTGATNNISGLIEDRFASPGLTWEVEEKRDVGLDLALWNNRVDISVDYFNNERTQILLQRKTVAQVSGFNQSPWQNFGVVANKGMDIGINLRNKFGDVTLSARGTYTLAKNKILEYDEIPPEYDWMKRTGKRVNVILAASGHSPLIAERLFTEDDFNITIDANGKKQYELKEGITGSPWLEQTLPGDMKYLDLNGDGTLNDYDRVYDPDGYHPSTPEIVYGFGFGAEYKQFYVNTFFQGAANVTVSLNWNARNFMPFHWGLEESNVRQEIVENRWTEANQDPYAFFPRLRTQAMGNTNTISTWWYRDGSFLRFKNLEFGYNFNKKLVQKLGIGAAHIYVMGHNLHVWDKVKINDPEQGNSSGGTQYPLSRTWTLGLEVTF